ncbi:SusC/RagA family TonB-linked outer membrane protein [Puteibacter caeruleilacunae]|nr:SusC/RagA family TonB-linked outer membrane protein [Puteibacter caeruleilacunae]
MKKNGEIPFLSGERYRKLFLQMKFLVIFMMVGLLQVNASVYSQQQKLSLKLKDASLESVLSTIEKKSEFTFLYSVEDVEHVSGLNLKVTDASVESILDQCLNRTNLTYEVSDRLVIIKESNVKPAESANPAQQKEVKGTVVDEDGEPIPGASVVVKGTTIGVTTDFDGKFALQIPANAETLIVSFVGMTSQEIAVAGKTEFNIVLASEATEVDEVVVTALGIKRETKKLGFAVTEVKGDDVAKANTVNPIQALQGQAAGVSVDNSDGGVFGAARINIRGISTLGSNNQPIFVIDGVILDNNTSGSSEWAAGSEDWGNELKNLNPDDFESVSLLKGSAATALYGSRALSGVVVITTKRNTKKKGLGVSFKQSIGIDHVYDTPDFQYEFGPGTVAGYISYGERDSKGDYYKWDTSQFKLGDFEGQEYPTYIGASGLAFGPRFDGRDVIGLDNKLTQYVGYKDNIKDAYDTGVSTNTNISIQGGNDKTKFYISDSFVTRKGTYPNNKFQRNSLLLKGIHELTDELNIEASISFVESKPENPTGNLGDMFLSGFSNYYDTKKYKQRQYWQAAHGGTPRNEDPNVNVPGNGFWFSVNMNSDVRKERVIRPIVKLNYKPFEWASISLEGNSNIYSYKGEKKQLGQGYLNEGGFYQLDDYEKIQRTIKGSFTVSHEINDFAGSLMVGGELFKTEDSYRKVKTDGGLIVPGQYFITNSKKTVIGEAWKGGEKKLSSAYFLASLSWRNQLFLDITGRNDWSSALVYANESGNNSYFYPSIGSSWIFSETFSLPDWMSFGKIRASWAQVGNDTKPYWINSGYEISTIEKEGGEYAYGNTFKSQLIDPSLEPERKNSISLGADMRFLNNRIGLDAEYYRETTKNQISEIPIPVQSGISTMLVNSGKVRNSGVEVSLKTTPVRTKDWEWNVDFNWWKNSNKIVELHEQTGAYKSLAGSPGYGNYRVGSVAYVGGEYGVLLSDSKPQVDENGNKLLFWDNDDQGAMYKRKGGDPEKIGSMLADFEGSINTSLRYKGFNVSALFEARYGGYIASYTNKYGTAYGYLKTSLQGRDSEHGGITYNRTVNGETRTYNDGIVMDGVFAAGQEVVGPDGTKRDLGGMSYQDAYDQGFVNPTAASYYHYWGNSWSGSVINDSWVSEVKYIALRQVALSYAIPNKLTDRWGIKNMNLSLVGRNLGFLYNSLPNHLNPDSRRGNRSDYNFIERGMTPYTATYTFTIQFNL